MASKKRWDSMTSGSRKLLRRCDAGRTNSCCSRGPAMQQSRESSPTISKFVEGEQPSSSPPSGARVQGDVYEAYVYTHSQTVTFGSDDAFSQQRRTAQPDFSV